MARLAPVNCGTGHSVVMLSVGVILVMEDPSSLLLSSYALMDTNDNVLCGDGDGTVELGEISMAVMMS